MIHKGSIKHQYIPKFWQFGTVYDIAAPSDLFRNEERGTVTINGPRCKAMLTDIQYLEPNNHGISELQFHQDCATCHLSNAMLAVITAKFDDWVISWWALINDLPRFCDSMHFDYFLEDYVKLLA